MHWRLDKDSDGHLLNDYGLVARLVQQQSHKPMIVAAGLEQCGTEAGMELLAEDLPELIDNDAHAVVVPHYMGLEM